MKGFVAVFSVTVLPKDGISRLDKWAVANGYSRSKAIRVLIERGIGS